MNLITKCLLCLFAVFCFYTGFSNISPLSKQAKVFGISTKKAVNNELKPVARQVFEARSARNEFSIQRPLQVIRNHESFRGAVQQSSILKLDGNVMESMLHSKHDFIELQLEDAAGKTWAMDLYRTSSVSTDFVVTTSQSGGDPVFINEGINYRGVIKGNYNSVAAFSIFDGNIIGMISSDEGNMVLHPLESEAESFIFYNDRDLNSEMPFSCGTDQLEWSGPEQGVEDGAGSRSLNDCVRVYIECDYALFLNKGSNVSNVVNWITAVYNNVATLYANEDINTAISEVFVWNTADPFSKTNASTALNQFRNLRPTFNGDLAHLAALGGNNLGGIAWVNALCTNYEYAYSNISSTYQNVPTYSWTVMVMTHEMGHNLGSNHTQWCGWSGGALDNCYQTEGSCSPGPAPVGGGTIMSYCHLTGYGINLNNGFGTQPGNRIRSRVSNVTCLSPGCINGGGGGEPQVCDTPTGLTAFNITSTTASISWNAVPGAISYIFQYRLSSSNTWSQVSLSSTGANFSSLAPNTSYSCRVQAVCSGSNSAFSNILTFTTLGNGNTCNAPTGLSASNVTSTSASINWSIVSGAASYTLEYKLSTSNTWIPVSVTTPPHILSGLIANSSYNVRVRANCTGSNSSYSTVLTFTTLANQTCNAPTGLSSSNITSNSAVINWSSVQGAVSYLFEYKLATSGTWIPVTVSSPPYTLNGLIANSAYNVRIRTNCAAGNSAYSTTLNFTTLNVQACNAPTGMASFNITSSSATINWSTVSGAVSYTLEYKEASSNTWTPVTVSNPPHVLSGLIANTSYNVRVRTNCAGNNSGFSSTLNFTTLNALTCNIPAGLSSSNISSNSAVINWTAVPGAISYTLEYKLASSGTWTPVSVINPPYTLNGLQSNSNYNVRILTNCSAGSSAFSSILNFTTLNIQICNAPTGLSTSNITSSSATITWNQVSGAISYTLEYKLSVSNTWIPVSVINLPHLLSGLVANSAYNVRVHTNCGSENSAYSNVLNFNTLSPPVCNPPGGLNASSISSNSAVLSWSSAQNALSYIVEYKASSSNTWIPVPVTGTSLTLSALAAETQYNWRVFSVCSGGTGEAGSSQNFVTLPAQNSGYCNSNGINSNLEWISKVAIGTILRNSGSDGGYFDASNLSTNLSKGRYQSITYSAGFSGGSRMLYWRIWIDLNADGDFSDAGELVVSRNSNSDGNLYSTFLIPNSSVNGQTRMRVQAKYNSYGNPCDEFPNGEVEDYSVNITGLLGLVAEGAGAIPEINMNEVKIFPNPVVEDLRFSFQSLVDSEVTVQVVDILGRLQMQEIFYAEAGENNFNITVADLHTGPYIFLIKNGKQILNFRFIKSE